MRWRAVRAGLRFLSSRGLTVDFLRSPVLTSRDLVPDQRATAAGHCADDCALLAADEGADTRAGRGAGTDDHCALRLRTNRPTLGVDPLRYRARARRGDRADHARRRGW